MKDEIILRGLKENNLKNINLHIPKEQITVFTGLSGSGKSSVVFDTIAVESKRQMTLNYPTYIRNQMSKYERPQVDTIENLSQVVVIEQRPATGSSRSTLGTYMDISPLIRLLFSRIGQPKVGEATDFLAQSAFGKCPECNGYGEVITPDVDKLIDFNQSLREGAVQFKPLSPSGWQGRWMITGGLFNPDIPIKKYTPEQRQLLLYGPPEGERIYAPFHTKNGPQAHEWDGIIPRFKRLYINRDISTLKQVSEEDVLNVSILSACATCHGTGLHSDVLASKIHGLNIVDFDHLQLTDLVKTLRQIRNPLGVSIATQAIPHVERLINMGLGYLSLERSMNTLSGGEAQRVKIARHLGSSLNNIIYIFDEPTAGLHPEEVNRLITMIKELKAHHNTVLLIEHNHAVIQIADEIIEMGPGAGAAGGEVVYQGKLSDISSASTAAFVEQKLVMNQQPREFTDYFSIKNANHNNLQNMSVDIPKNVLVSLCGVSGSGKSSLMLDAFLEEHPETISVTQRAIGISSRSTLATYMGIMDNIRSIMANATGEPAGLFSFNSLGACPVCKGKGVITPDVAFAEPITTTCEACAGTRYSNEALSFHYKGKNIVEILQLTIEETSEYFDQAAIKNKIAILKDVGLDYLTLGQTTSSLSGGEIQRLKLASHLQKSGQIYVLDEPSLGLHTKDSDKLFSLLQRLIEQGNSVIIIEHRLDFIAKSDWVIELGPGAGNDGGDIIFEGTPGELLEANTLTAKWLKKAIKNKS